MALANYTDLLASAADWLHRSDMTARIPDLVKLGESHLNRALRCPEMETWASLPTSITDRYAALPSRFLDVVALTDAYGGTLEHGSSGAVARAAAVASVGRPYAYAVTSQFEFERVSDQVYALDLIYVKGFDLSADATNWLLTRHPDAYLFATLAEAAPFIGDDPRAGLWAAKRDGALAQVMASENRRQARTMRVDPALVGNTSFDIRKG
jgi:hypothetical protein